MIREKRKMIREKRKMIREKLNKKKQLLCNTRKFFFCKMIKYN